MNVKPKLGWFVNGAQGSGTIIAMSIGWCIYHDLEADIEYAEPWEQISVAVDQPDAPESVLLDGPERPVQEKHLLRCMGCGDVCGTQASPVPSFLCTHCTILKMPSR